MRRPQANAAMGVSKRWKPAKRSPVRRRRTAHIPSGAVGPPAAATAVVGNTRARASWRVRPAVEVLSAQRRIWKRQALATATTALKMPGARLTAPGVNGLHGADVQPAVVRGRPEELASLCKRPPTAAKSAAVSSRISSNAPSDLALGGTVPSVHGLLGVIALTSALVTGNAAASSHRRPLEVVGLVAAPPWN